MLSTAVQGPGRSPKSCLCQGPHERKPQPDHTPPAGAHPSSSHCHLRRGRHREVMTEQLTASGTAPAPQGPAQRMLTTTLRAVSASTLYSPPQHRQGTESSRSGFQVTRDSRPRSVNPEPRLLPLRDSLRFLPRRWRHRTAFPTSGFRGDRAGSGVRHTHTRVTV